MLDRKVAPKHDEITLFNLPSPEIYTLSSGVPLFVHRGVSQQVLKVELVFSGAKWDEPKNGLSYFTALLLEKGTGTKTSFEIADYFDRHGASVEISPGFDFVSVSLFSLTKNITHVLPLFVELVTSSVFPEKELTIQKDIFNQNLKVNNEKNSYVASKLIRQHLFGDSHPYGRSIEEGDVNKLSGQDLNNFFHNQFSLLQSFVVGAVDESLLKKLVTTLSEIPGDSKKSQLTFSASQDESSIYLKKPGSTQSSLRLGKRTIGRSHQDYPALILINHIFGGYFGSRLMKNIREDKGLTYGIYSSLNNLRNNAFFMIAADVNKINKDKAVTEIKKELNLLSNKLVTSQELHNAKNHLLGSLQLEIANPFSIIEKIKTIHLYGLDENFYNKLFLDIHDLDEATLKKVSNNYLDDNMVEIAVG